NNSPLFESWHCTTNFISTLIVVSFYILTSFYECIRSRTFVQYRDASLMFSALVVKRFLAPWQGLLLALLVVLLWQPLMVLSAGFWLSFGAVATILYLTWGRVGKKRRGWEMIRLQWGISLAMIPLTLIFFQQGSLISPAVNLLAIPWVGWIIVPLALLGCLIVWLAPLLSHLLWWLAIKNLQLLWIFLTAAANLPGSSWQQSLTSWQLLLALLGMPLFLAPRGLPARYLGGVLLLPALFVRPQSIVNGDAKITVLDSRYGEAITVQTQRHFLLFSSIL
ncbi:MAG: ComEC/Rec2 family competence protein, partial [Gammaproteobacteria bacterium]|nr:ComEC/Rec2 family competence protein [Gammaproteobacteria bacterium]